MAQIALTSTTQDFLDIHDITNNLVFMKDGSATAILLVGAMNFSLLAEEEQDAVIYAYAALLNSLNFQVQINIQSKTKDATAYLDLLREQEEVSSSQDKRRRIAQYREFVGQLIQERNVLDKKFYVVIPAAPIELGIIPPQSVIPGSASFDITTIEKNTLVEKAIGILSPRIDHLVGQFSRIGLFARQLSTQEIIQNFYANYNPEAVEGQQITNTSDYTTPMVQASMFTVSLQNRQKTIKEFTQDGRETQSFSLENSQTLDESLMTTNEVQPTTEITEQTPVATEAYVVPSTQTPNQNESTNEQVSEQQSVTPTVGSYSVPTLPEIT